jgi:hypothetical protein
MDLWGVKRNLFAVNFEVSNSRLRVPYTSPPRSLGFQVFGFNIFGQTRDLKRRFGSI